MTQQKTVKRRVRARMAKTGERYTAARAQIARRSAPPPATGDTEPIRPDEAPASADAGGPNAIATDAMASDPVAATTQTAGTVPDSPFRGGYGASDEALVKRTGQTWAHWYRVLDTWGAADKPHPEIARFLHLDMGVEGWWAQELTVRYEMAVGRRVPNQRTDGFEATASKTIKAPPERVYAAVVDDAERSSWLDRPVKLRKANQNRTPSAFATVRFDWEDSGERVVIWLADKGERTVVSMAHQRLPGSTEAEARKAFWRERLTALAAHVEGRR